MAGLTHWVYLMVMSRGGVGPIQRPMEGVRVLEVAQLTFVPAASVVLGDPGVVVSKIEHAERGHAQRGLVRVLGCGAAGKGWSFFPIMEGRNRGKRSVGLGPGMTPRPGWRSDRRNLSIFTDYLPTSGVRIEIVDRVRMPDFSAYLRSKTPH